MFELSVFAAPSLSHTDVAKDIVEPTCIESSNTTITIANTQKVMAKKLLSCMDGCGCRLGHGHNGWAYEMDDTHRK